ncbi:MAG: hypothetical protein Q9191_006471 [Dirinaria sp. TL-2023a]
MGEPLIAKARTRQSASHQGAAPDHLKILRVLPDVIFVFPPSAADCQEAAVVAMAMHDFIIARAELAQDVAAALDNFLTPVSDYATEITALIGECYGLSSALRELNTCYSDLHFHNNYDQVSTDIRVTLESISYTFDDVNDLLTGLGSTVHLSRTAAYRAVWDNIIVHFERQSNNSLGRRIGIYRKFLGAVICLIEGDLWNVDEYNEWRYRVDYLYRIQDNRLALEMNNLALGAPGSTNRRAFNRADHAADDRQALTGRDRSREEGRLPIGLLYRLRHLFSGMNGFHGHHHCRRYPQVLIKEAFGLPTVLAHQSQPVLLQRLSRRGQASLPRTGCLDCLTNIGLHRHFEELARCPSLE